MSDYAEAIALLRCWISGCGDPRFSTDEQCEELLAQSADFMRRISMSDAERVRYEERVW